MLKISNFARIFLLILALCAQNTQAQVYTDEDENAILLTTQYGTTVIRIFPHVAPKHVKRIKELVRSDHYKEAEFLRVIPAFMAQVGVPSNQNRGTGKKIRAEFSKHKHVRGTVSMARREGKHSADDQFFICFNSAPHLDGKYTIFGQVVAGMEFIDYVKAGDPETGTVENPTVIQNMWIASDAAASHKDVIDAAKKQKRAIRQKAWDDRWHESDPTR